MWSPLPRLVRDPPPCPMVKSKADRETEEGVKVKGWARRVPDLPIASDISPINFPSHSYRRDEKPYL